MKPQLEHLPLKEDESFVVRRFEYAYYPTPWHYHPEYELVYVVSSSGQRFIGDDIADFDTGDLALLGPDLPHLYRNDPTYYAKRSKLRARSIVVHFLPNAFGEGFFDLPEAKPLIALFRRSQRGLQITGRLNQDVSKGMFELLEMQGLARWLKLIQILHMIAAGREVRYISKTVMTGQNEKGSERLNKVFEYVMKNFKGQISVSTIAREVNLSENSFSRYFKLRTRKTFIEFVNDIRLTYACKLLIADKQSISDICFDAGFNNLSNFNKQFRRKYGESPLNYRHSFQNKIYG